MYKRDIINFLFIISFPFYGIGTYFSAVKSPSVGYMISIAPHLLIIFIYSMDILFKEEFRIRLNTNYLFMLIYLVSLIVSLFIALGRGLPESNFLIMATKSVLLIVPFHAFLIAILYNERKGSLLQLTLVSLSLLLAINLIGYFVLGLSNGVHSIDGRLNFPFLDGLYSGASLLAIINLLLLYYLAQPKRPIRFALLSTYFLVNLLMFFQINSRLTILVFALVLLLSIIGMLRSRGLYLISMFTVPILLGSGAVIYKVLQLPGLSSLMQRIDVEDVVSFNGRAYLWKDAMDWLFYDQQGFWLGNGYKGHYFLGLINDVAKLWNEKNVFHMHLHSTSLEILVCQGIVFFALFAFLFYIIHQYYTKRSLNRQEEGAFLPVVIFLLFIMQVDTFLYLDNLGFVIFALLVARVAIRNTVNIKQEIRVMQQSRPLQKLTKRQGIASFNH